MNEEESPCCDKSKENDQLNANLFVGFINNSEHKSVIIVLSLCGLRHCLKKIRQLAIWWVFLISLPNLPHESFLEIVRQFLI